MTYRTLKLEAVIQTLIQLERRVGERFPDSGLRQVIIEVIQIAQETEQRIRWISAPNIFLRVLISILVAGIIFGLYAFASLSSLALSSLSLTELVQTLEAATNELILLSIGLYSLLSLEGKIKRKRALSFLHQLRSVVHVVDMHQLTKDPAREDKIGLPTASAPKSNMSQYELSRYLDYCSELLSLLGKLAALYAQHLDDEVILDTVAELETLTSAISNKIWQKIVITTQG